MARVTVTLGAPSSDSANDLRWLYPAGSYVSIGTAGSSSLFANQSIDYLLRELRLWASNTRSFMDMVSSQSTNASNVDFNSGFEGYVTRAFTLQAGSLSLSIGGPGSPLFGRDPSEPYSWIIVADQRPLVAAFIPAYRALPDAIKQTTTVTFDDGDVPAPGGPRMYAIATATPDNLVEVNLENPAASRIVGRLPSRISIPRAMAISQAERVVYVIADSNSFWRLDFDDLSREGDGYGRLGQTFVGFNTQDTGMCFHAGRLIAKNGQGFIYAINPLDPRDTSGDFGQIGRLSSIQQAETLFSTGSRLYALTHARALVRVNLSNLASSIADGVVRGTGGSSQIAATVLGGQFILIGANRAYRADLSDLATDAVYLGAIGTTEGQLSVVTAASFFDPDPFLRVSGDYDSGLRTAGITDAEFSLVEPPPLRVVGPYVSGLRTAGITRAEFRNVPPEPLAVSGDYETGIRNTSIARADFVLTGGPPLAVSGEHVTGLRTAGVQRSVFELLTHPEDRAKAGLGIDDDGLYRTTTGLNRLRDSALERWSPDPVLNHLLVLTLEDGTVLRFWSGDVDVEIDDNVYIGSKLLEVGSGQASDLNNTGTGIQVSVSVADAADRAYFERPSSRIAASLHTARSDDGGRTWVTVGFPVIGVMAQGTLQGALLRFTVQGRSIEADRPRGSKHHNAGTRPAGDRGMANLHKIQGDGVLGTWPYRRSG